MHELEWWQVTKLDVDVTLITQVESNMSTMQSKLKATSRLQKPIRIRVANDWNKLLQPVIEATSINCFKNQSDKYFS